MKNVDFGIAKTPRYEPCGNEEFAAAFQKQLDPWPLLSFRSSTKEVVHFSLQHSVTLLVPKRLNVFDFPTFSGESNVFHDFSFKFEESEEDGQSRFGAMAVALKKLSDRYLMLTPPFIALLCRTFITLEGLMADDPKMSEARTGHN